MKWQIKYSKNTKNPYKQIKKQPKKTTKTNPWLKTRIGFLVVIIFPDDYDGIVTIKKSKFAL